MLDVQILYTIKRISRVFLCIINFKQLLQTLKGFTHQAQISNFCATQLTVSDATLHCQKTLFGQKYKTELILWF